MELTNLKTIRELMARHNVHFSKSLGQNFIVNPSICPRIVEQGGVTPGCCVLEIGAGVGVLTRELAKTAGKVVCVELDQSLFPLLGESLAGYDNVKLIHGDVLKLDLAALFREEFPGKEVVVCANLPYYITSPVIMRLLEERLPIRTVTVMVQREAAGRICAGLPSREAGAITVAVRYYCEPHVLFGVSRGSFVPAPNVDSAVIRLELHHAPPVQVNSEELFFRVIRGAFSQRRKTILNCLASALGQEKAAVYSWLTAAGVPPGARAEQLTLLDFAKIADEIRL
jgi:16S rRNA (adenine1518-N6/adenine1519-N6)-dimethyltransferase